MLIHYKINQVSLSRLNQTIIFQKKRVYFVNLSSLTFSAVLNEKILKSETYRWDSTIYPLMYKLHSLNQICHPRGQGFE